MTEPTDLRNQITQAQLVVVKVGTRLITRGPGQLNQEFLASLVGQIKRLSQDGRQLLVITSGAIHLGSASLSRRGSEDGLSLRQAAAAIGQPALMQHYITALGAEGLVGAQILLTTEDMQQRSRYLHVRNTLQMLLAQGIVPIINENDTVSVEGVTFGENDRLAAVVAAALRTDLLVFLSDQPGLFTADPRRDAAAEFVPVVMPGDQISHYADGTGGTESRGGMEKKLEAAQMVVDCGIPLVIADGEQEDVLIRILAGAEVGTLFVARGAPPSRKLWLATALEPSGSLLIDKGACQALRDRDGSSLLPVGVVQVKGSFQAGDLVQVVDSQDEEVARGLVNYSSEQVAAIQGHHSDEIERILGHVGDDEVIHRDNLVVTGSSD